MQLVEYTHDKCFILEYINFIKLHYSNDPRISFYIKRIIKQLDSKNPFFEFGEIRSFLLKKDTKVIGHCSAIIDRRNEHVGLIGFYDCIRNEFANDLLLESAIEWLKRNGCSIIRGPVNLTIWHDYRFITKQERNIEIFDPFNKSYYSDFWKKKGFICNEKYVSAVRNDAEYVLPFTKKAYEALIKRGFKIRPFNKKDPISDLKVILLLANEIFIDSWNFVPLTYNELQHLYDELLNMSDLHFVEIIEDNNACAVGFCFCLPNPYNRNQLILKTLGVLKEYRRQNIAASLLYSQHLKGKNEGFSEFYYPLIKTGNNITKLPYEGYKIITEYEVFELV